MEQWLQTEEFKDLAEAPEGIHLWGTLRAPSTLNVLDSRSLDLIEQMYDDMLPVSSSKYFNMNFDEPFELGLNKTKEECEKKGKANVYLEFVHKAYELIKKHNKIPLILGDVLINHEDVLDKIPNMLVSLKIQRGICMFLLNLTR